MDTMQSVNPEFIDHIVRQWPTLRADSVVFEVGAYKGRWACDIYDTYKCQVYAFEPQEWAYQILHDEVSSRFGVFPFNFALGTKSAVLDMGEWGTDACSFLHSEREHGRGMMRDVREFLRANDVSHIDLMMINIEGYEYELVKYLITTGIVHSIDALCIQWHTFADGDGVKYTEIEDYLRRFFVLTQNYFPDIQVWERNKS